MRNRVSYSKEHHEQSKREKRKLVTIDIMDPKGARITMQGVASPALVATLARAMTKMGAQR